ncbi:MarR family winged helix-turn-helix transcriptional regulator [Catenuloplanes atrovinosus]|uniref:DNA-binding MarR family transcriptional regulator n=1 Tax=Catenuloplanes atrovinosus TaxID=137266 RepID=A0AAE4CC25_9ACTN|nr:MarR family winged helix-turn-helix transcriptional regulator [Catenuloplanes atrovinosus]MDR7276135.1 DNA-binding MarR family transcriptional regulator [Catenuloplanes atrovinosus]
MPPAESESLPELFWAVARRLRHQSRETLAPFAITPSQSRALGVLMHHGSLRLNAVAEHLRIAPRSATEVIDDLEALGYATRRPDPDDRRATLVSPTEAGIAAGEAIRAARLAEADRLFGALPQPDREALARILRTLL